MIEPDPALVEILGNVIEARGDRYQDFGRLAKRPFATSSTTAVQVWPVARAVG